MVQIPDLVLGLVFGIVLDFGFDVLAFQMSLD